MEGIQGVPQQPKQETEPIDQIESPQEKGKESSLELSQEVVEKILEKTKNINTPGTAFSVVGEYSAGWFKNKIERGKKDFLDDMMDEETFTKALMKSSLGLHIKGGDFSRPEIPLRPEYYSPDQVYKNYKDLIKHNKGNDGYIAQEMKHYGLNKMGLSLDVPTPKKEFLEKYNVELKRQQEEQQTKINQAYQEYTQNLKDYVYGQSFERFKKDWLRKQFDYRNERKDLIDFNSNDPGYYVGMYFREYNQLLHPNEWDEYYDNNDSINQKRSVKGVNNRYGSVDRLKIMGLVEGQDEFLVEVNEEEFKKRYFEIIEKQTIQLDREAEEAYKEYMKNFDENEFKGSRLKTVKSILKNGIFGGRSWTEQGYVSMNPSDWAKDVRQKRTPRNVFFNMVGNFHNTLTYGPTESNIGDSFFFRRRHHVDEPNDGVAIVFDKGNLRYRMDDPNFASGYYRSHGSSRVGGSPDSQYGFRGPARIAPRKFQGIVISCTDEVKKTDEYGTKSVYSTDKDKWIQTAKDIAKTMIETDSDEPDKLVPIYDVFGNMLWPVEMSKEEIIKKIGRKK